MIVVFTTKKSRPKRFRAPKPWYKSTGGIWLPVYQQPYGHILVPYTAFSQGQSTLWGGTVYSNGSFWATSNTPIDCTLLYGKFYSTGYVQGPFFNWSQQ